MGAAREKDQADFDLETFVDLFDTAMSSDNPAVQKALRNLIMIAAIVNAEDKDAGMRKGPLRRVIDDQNNIIRRLERVENDRIYPQTPTPYVPGTPVPLGPYVGSPLTWPNTSNPPPNSIWCSTGTNSISKDNLTAMSISAIQDLDKKYNTLLDKLETK